MPETELMMSAELEGQIPDLEEQLSDFGIAAIVLCEIPGQEIPFHSLLVGVTASDDPELEVKTDLKTALDLFKNKDAVTFSQIKINHQESILDLGGPFTIAGIKLHSVNQAKQTCVLWLKLSTQANKQVIF